jgi:hypothetical protein
VDENPRNGDQAEGINSRNKVEEGNVNWPDVRGDTKWWNK